MTVAPALGSGDDGGMGTLLAENALLALFVTLSIGYAVGRIKLAGSRFGVAAVLFVGLAVGALQPAPEIPPFVFQLGLVLFVYTVGLSTGPAFFTAFRRQGRRDVLYIWLGVMTPPLLLTIALAWLLPVTTPEVAGLFAGSGNNTPAFAAVLDVLSGRDGAQAALSQVVVGFSLAYPLGVLGRMVAIFVTSRWWRIDFAAEAYALRHTYPINEEIVNRTVLVTRESAVGRPLRTLRRAHDWDVVFGRLVRGEDVVMVFGDLHLALGDRVVVVGRPAAVEQVTADLGETADEHLFFDRTIYDTRRIFVSNPAVVGQTLASLDLKEQHGAIVSRVRRGDVDVLATSDMVLELGDRVRVVAPRDELPALGALFGDSVTDVSRVDFVSLGVGVTLGLLVGLLALPLPGGVVLRLGFAGGPLLVALVLGTLRRSGPIVWTLPYGANLTLRQFGTALLLAGVGINAGDDLMQTLANGEGAWLLLLGTAVVLGGAFIALFVGYKLLRMPYSIVIGMLGGQPAVLGYALDQAGNPLPNVGYALMFPIAIIVNIIYAQLLLLLPG